jgi:hypothetical protein
MNDATHKTFEGWAILELMGHRRLGGYVRDVELFSGRFCRIDVPKTDGLPGELEATQFYGANSVYCLTPTTEELARAVAAANRPAPVQRWELPAAKESPAVRSATTPADDDFDDDQDDDGVPY